MMASPQTERSQRPRSLTMLSGGSKKSHRSRRSSGSKDMTDNSIEKPRLHNTSKADPSAAINEAQPAAVALESSNLGDLRSMKFKDQYGNEITDPDRSNPSRPRLERPLETIRSFEAARYKSDNIRPSENRPVTPGTMNGMYGSRRNSSYSAFEGSNYGGHSNGYSGEYRSGYYRNSSYGGYGGRPDSYVDNYMQPNQHYPNPRGPRHPRHHADPVSNQYPPSTPGMDVPSSPEPMSPAAYGGHKPSYDNISAPDAGSEGYAPYSTNPTTANSSFDNFPPKPVEGPHGAQGPAENYPGSGFGNNGFTPPPLNRPAEPRHIIKLGGGDDAYASPNGPISPASPGSPEKKRRQSWLARRFSKRDR